MEPVLIISRSFPPNNQTASFRALSFAKFLHEYGYYPIVITRNWDNEVKEEQDEKYPSGSILRIEKNNNYEVHYVPFKGFLSQRISNENRFISKLINYIDVYFGKISFFNPYDALLKHAEKLVAANKQIRKALVTAPPFYIFRYGYFLHKKYSVKWVADYRDEWNTEGNVLNTNYSDQIFNPISRTLYSLFISKKVQEKNEIKWVSNSSVITTVSVEIAKRLNLFHNIKSVVIPNGYDEDDFVFDNDPVKFKEFTIVYSGNLYPTQQIEILCESLIRLRKKNIKLHLLFIGGNSYKGLIERISFLMGQYIDQVEFTERVSKQSSIHMQKKAHVLLMVSHKGKSGIPSSKIYEYAAINNPILLCPSDNGIMELTVNELENSIICNTVDSCVDSLEYLFNNYNKISLNSTEINKEIITKYSRKHQVRTLARVFDSL